MNAVAKSMDAAEAATRRLHDVREDSRVECVRTIRRLEEQLVAFLSKEPLRGMPNLMPSDKKFNAMRVRSTNQDPLPHPKLNDLAGPWTLLLLPTGKLVMGRRVRMSDFALGFFTEVVDATDEDLIAQDIHAIATTVCEAMQKHTEAVEKTTANYAQLRLMAFGLGELLERVFPPA